MSAREVFEAEQLLRAIYESSDLEALKLYIKRGYDVNVRPQQQQQQTLLHVAAALLDDDQKYQYMADLLIEKGIAVDTRDEHRRTALMYCRSAEIAAVFVVALIFTLCAIREGLHFITLRLTRILPW
jgi:hypothetical protein